MERDQSRDRSDLRLSTGWDGGRNAPRCRLVGLAVLLEHARPAGHGGPHGSLRHTGGGLGGATAPFAAHFLHTTASATASSGAQRRGRHFAALVLPRLQGRLHLDAIVAAATLANALRYCPGGLAEPVGGRRPWSW